jgi:hypothetical protein
MIAKCSQKNGARALPHRRRGHTLDQQDVRGTNGPCGAQLDGLRKMRGTCRCGLKQARIGEYFGRHGHRVPSRTRGLDMDAKTGANTKTGTLTVGNKNWDFPVYEGTIGPEVVDISKLYAQTGMFTYDPGFTSTGSCDSKITYIDGDAGVLG